MTAGVSADRLARHITCKASYVGLLHLQKLRAQQAGGRGSAARAAATPWRAGRRRTGCGASRRRQAASGLERSSARRCHAARSGGASELPLWRCARSSSTQQHLLMLIADRRRELDCIYAEADRCRSIATAPSAVPGAVGVWQKARPEEETSQAAAASRSASAEGRHSAFHGCSALVATLRSLQPLVSRQRAEGGAWMGCTAAARTARRAGTVHIAVARKGMCVFTRARRRRARLTCVQAPLLPGDAPET
jgi:hypothetical protein